MSYIVIGDDGTVTRHDADPTPDDLMRLVGDGTPQPLPTPADVVMWVNDDFVSLNQQGAVARNLVASLAAVGLDVPGMPVIAGPAILTDLAMVDGQLTPTSLDAENTDALMLLLRQTTDVLAGRDVPSMDANMQASLRIVAMQMEVRPLTMVTVQTVSLDEFLEFLGERQDGSIPMPVPHEDDGPAW